MLPQGEGRVVPRPIAAPGQLRVRADLPPRTSLGIVWDRKRDADYLAHVDARTFDVKRRTLLGGQGMGPRALSPDGTKIAFGTRRGGVRIHSVRTLERLHSIHLGGGWTSEVMWPADDRILLFVVTYGMASAMSIDPKSGKVIAEELLIGTPLRTKKTGGGLVTLLAGPQGQSAEPHAAKLAFVSNDGMVTYAQLDRIEAGWHMPADTEDSIGENIDPGLAVRNGVATVVGTDGEIAHVDLDTMKVDYVADETGLMDRITAWLVPPAHAKLSDGTSVWADWYGDSLVVGGYRHEMEVTERNGPTGSADIEEHAEGLGVMFVNPDTGDSTVVNEIADRFARTDGKVFAYSTGFVADGRHGGIGIVAYGPRGEELWHAFGDSPITHVSAGRGVLYVTHGYSRVLRSVVDTDSGNILNTRQTFVHVLHV